MLILAENQPVKRRSERWRSERQLLIILVRFEILVPFRKCAGAVEPGKSTSVSRRPSDKFVCHRSRPGQDRRGTSKTNLLNSISIQLARLVTQYREEL